MPSGSPEGEKGEDELTTSTKRMETIADLGIGKPQTVLNLTEDEAGSTFPPTKTFDS